MLVVFLVGCTEKEKPKEKLYFDIKTLDGRFLKLNENKELVIYDRYNDSIIPIVIQDIKGIGLAADAINYSATNIFTGKENHLKGSALVVLDKEDKERVFQIEGTDTYIFNLMKDLGFKVYEVTRIKR